VEDGCRRRGGIGSATSTGNTIAMEVPLWFLPFVTERGRRDVTA
jgi:hypothetical protein